MQAALFDHLLCSDALSEQELSILRWGKNAKVKTPKRLTINHQQGTYKKATAMECLVSVHNIRMLCLLSFCLYEPEDCCWTLILRSLYHASVICEWIFTDLHWSKIELRILTPFHKRHSHFVPGKASHLKGSQRSTQPRLFACEGWLPIPDKRQAIG